MTRRERLKTSIQRGPTVLSPAIASFSGHETFPFRFPWLKKGFDAASADPQVFWDEDAAMTTLGVGKNMVRSIRHWCLVSGVLEDARKKQGARRAEMRPSEFGVSVFSDSGFDPYLEDPATLWLLHWRIATAAQLATTWHWAFSHVHDPEFTRDSLLAALEAWVQTAGYKRVSQGSLRRDIDCFIRTYVPSRQTKRTIVEDTLDCPLVELNLIQEAGDRTTYQFVRGPQDHLPDFVFCYATLTFWEMFAAQRQTLSLHELTYEAGSPGVIFKMSENSLVDRLDRLERFTKGAVSYDETAGVKQLYRHRELSSGHILSAGYRELAAIAGRA